MADIERAFTGRYVISHALSVEVAARAEPYTKEQKAIEAMS